ncbi:hypothetical protein D3C87_419860 [compost metagenome]
MLETSFGLSLFLKPSAKEPNLRYLYLRVTVDGIRKEIQLKENVTPDAGMLNPSVL